MAKRCETFDHTADVGLLARADSLGELLEALAEGLAGFICPRETVAAARKREVRVRSEDVEALAVDFLGAVLNLIQAERFVVARVSVKDVSERSVLAEALGEPYDARRHDLSTEVKAVTYHMLRIAREGKEWVGRVVLDL
jgi:SHS2 domain-containing protein